MYMYTCVNYQECLCYVYVYYMLSSLEPWTLYMHMDGHSIIHLLNKCKVCIPVLFCLAY